MALVPILQQTDLGAADLDVEFDVFAEAGMREIWRTDQAEGTDHGGSAVRDVGLGVELVLAVDAALDLSRAKASTIAGTPARKSFFAFSDFHASVESLSGDVLQTLGTRVCPQRNLVAHEDAEAVDRLPLVFEARSAADLEIAGGDVDGMGDLAPFRAGTNGPSNPSRCYRRWKVQRNSPSSVSPVGPSTLFIHRRHGHQCREIRKQFCIRGGLRAFRHRLILEEVGLLWAGAEQGNEALADGEDGVHALAIPEVIVVVKFFPVIHGRAGFVVDPLEFDVGVQVALVGGMGGGMHMPDGRLQEAEGGDEIAHGVFCPVKEGEWNDAALGASALMGIAELDFRVNALDAKAVIEAMREFFGVAALKAAPAVFEDDLTGLIGPARDIERHVFPSDGVLLLLVFDFVQRFQLRGEDEPAFALGLLRRDRRPGADDDPEVIELEINRHDLHHAIDGRRRGVVFGGDLAFIEAFLDVPRLGEGGIDDPVPLSHIARGLAPWNGDGGEGAFVWHERIQRTEVVAAATGFGIRIVRTPDAFPDHAGALAVSDFAAAMLAAVVRGLGDGIEIPLAVAFHFIGALAPEAQAAIAMLLRFDAELQDDALAAAGAWDVVVALIREEELRPDAVGGDGGRAGFDDEREREVLRALLGVIEGARLEFRLLPVFVHLVHLQEARGAGGEVRGRIRADEIQRHAPEFLFEETEAVAVDAAFFGARQMGEGGFAFEDEGNPAILWERKGEGLFVGQDPDAGHGIVADDVEGAAAKDGGLDALGAEDEDEIANGFIGVAFERLAGVGDAMEAEWRRTWTPRREGWRRFLRTHCETETRGGGLRTSQ